MKIEVYATQNSVQEKDLKDRVVVVVDVLRATTTIITALYNGCKEIIPTAGIEEAINIARNYDKDAFLLGGERNIQKIDGFDLSNSPLEYTRQKVEGRTVLITTTNGTKAIRKAAESKKAVLAGFVNADAAAEYIASMDEDITFLCAGTEGKFSLDDIMVVGVILARLKYIGKPVDLDDLGMVCLHLYENYKDDIRGFLKNTHHYKNLVNAGLEKDMEICFGMNSVPAVVVYQDGVIRRADKIRSIG